MNRLFLMMPLALLAGCATHESFPSLATRPGEQPRVIEAPQPEQAAAVPAELVSRFEQDLAAVRKDLTKLKADAQAADKTLSQSLSALKGQKQGSDAWSNGQIALSRYEIAMAPLVGIEARLTPLLRLTDGLESDHPQRAAVEALAREAAGLSEQGRARILQANRQLG